ncbi:hypothetical protein [Luteolibacter luteus]|uniref:Uncharacterized protein n=1 Tax=Luteolibacter luteus TaxID=2728835 RepID=A0A858RI53_9BACT|nr:hypothetical protein [Luteolibacter luteus]QJE96866.1 hypothetical protein HHL09_14085 [Luteolibacter luteus]
MVRLLLLALLIFAGGVRAASTAAWKVSLETLAPDHKTNEKIRKLEKPPGESAFFQPGDELWDVSSVLEDESLIPYGYIEASYEEEEKPRGPWKGEWAVWNARLGSLVARGSYADLLKAQLAWDFEKAPDFVQAKSSAKPNVFRMQLDWLRPGAKAAFQSISMICEGGKMTKKTEGGVSIEADPSVGYSEQMIFTRIAATWVVEKESQGLEVTTSGYFEDGKRAFVARHGTGEDGWELYLTCREQRADGTPAAEARLLENKYSGPRPWRGGDGRVFGEFRIPLQGERSVVWSPIPPDLGSRPMPLLKHDLQVPENLRRWIEGPLVDCSTLLKGEGINVEAPGFFAGYDVLAHQLVVVGDEATHAAIKRLLGKLGGPPETNLLIELCPETGNTGIVVRDGERGGIWELRGQESEAIFEVEATRGTGSVALRLFTRLMADGADKGELTIGMDLIPRRWQKMMEASSGEAVEVLIRVGDAPP